MPPKKFKKREARQIGWVTVTYRSVLLGILFFLMMVAAVIYFAFPKATQGLLDSGMGIVNSIFNGSDDNGKKTKAAGDQKADFIMLDGAVKVKKKNSNTWISADYTVPLEKGDVVQTGAEGMAKIKFADQTNYTVKPDSLIVIEENSTNADQQTQVAVQVTTGTVDLATATYSQGSKSQVIVAGARATLAPESAAEVRNDPRADKTEIIVKKGSGQVARGEEVVSLGNYEKVSFQADSKTMTRDREVGPPTLIDPANMLPVFTTSTVTAVKFAWTPLDNVRAYHIRISRNPYFTQLLLDKKVAVPEFLLPGIAEGAYYWSVQAVDDRGRESVESERNRFTVIPRNNEDGLKLDLDPFIQHGRIIELRGKTESGARVMVNGGEVPLVNGDGSFRYLTPPLPNGENVITITAQNARGGVSTQTKKVVIQ